MSSVRSCRFFGNLDDADAGDSDIKHDEGRFLYCGVGSNKREREEGVGSGGRW